MRATALSATNLQRLSTLMAVHLWRGLTSLAVSLKTLLTHSLPAPLPGILVVVEGQNDVEFLRRISRILHAEDPVLPDLVDMERQGGMIFVPFGGGDSRPWAFRLAGLGRAQFHLYDRDVPPATEARQLAADIVNWRPNCRAFLTRKRSLENYLHGDAIFEASGIRVEFCDDDNVADLVARHVYERHEGHLPWQELPARARKRLRGKAKQWLNTRATDRMTPERLARQDPDGEVRSWLTTIVQLARNWS